MSSSVTVAAACYPAYHELCFADLVTLAGEEGGMLLFDADNADRVSAAAAARVAFAERTGPDHDGEPADTAVTDLLVNLMHLCDSGGMAFYGLPATARMHHGAETESGEEGR
ncbi:hypothetical protein PUG81_29390 [Erwiniaceae bacterium L1_54_6]|jgi:hypothetical protein|nr:hypothetical protein [Erwiniaceae bacterium L1_54_6]